jgi:acetyl esterase/lipase
VFVGGDSAGGNLALGLMSHILHPHPKLSDDLRIDLSAPLAGAILTSPWVKFPTDDDSVKRNAGSDVICEGAADRWVGAFQGTVSLAIPDQQPPLTSSRLRTSRRLLPTSDSNGRLVLRSGQDR